MNDNTENGVVYDEQEKLSIAEQLQRLSFSFTVVCNTIVVGNTDKPITNLNPNRVYLSIEFITGAAITVSIINQQGQVDLCSCSNILPFREWFIEKDKVMQIMEMHAITTGLNGSYIVTEIIKT